MGTRIIYRKAHWRRRLKPRDRTVAFDGNRQWSPSVAGVSRLWRRLDRKILGSERFCRTPNWARRDQACFFESMYRQLDFFLRLRHAPESHPLERLIVEVIDERSGEKPGESLFFPHPFSTGLESCHGGIRQLYPRPKK